MNSIERFSGSWTRTWYEQRAGQKQYGQAEKKAQGLQQRPGAIGINGIWCSYVLL